MLKAVIVVDLDEDEMREVFMDNETPLPELVTEVMNNIFFDDIQSRIMKTTNVVITTKDVILGI